MATALLILTNEGLRIARRLRERMDGPATIFGPSCVVGECRAAGRGSVFFEAEEPGVRGWVGPLRGALPAVWREHDCIVAVMAVGALVRLIAPLLGDKRHDPGVVAVDDAGRFAVSVVGGHGGGANALAYEVATALGAVPVVTTASDSRSLPAADLIGRDRGWALEGREDLTRVAAAIVRREPVAVYQDAGESDWWEPFGPWPESFRRVEDVDSPESRGASARLVISDRIEPAAKVAAPAVVYRPRTLVAGIGCKRGTAREVIAAHVVAQFAANGLAIGSLAAVATVTLKADEPGLIAFAAERGVPLIAFSPDELEAQAGIETPSDRVREKIGIPGVCEPAALRASGASRLLVPKVKGPGVTLSVARVPDRVASDRLA